MIKRIRKGIPFEALALDNSFRIKISEYVPYVCTAIHDGSNFRDELKIKTVLSDYERWYEEDPFTGDFISSMPIVLVGHDSRFEYDLNRAPEEAVYDTAWGKKVWKRPLTKRERERSQKKHRNYYRVTHALIKKLEELYDGCVVYDMHSYNYKRWDRPVPVFNIGTENISDEFEEYVAHWLGELSAIELPGIETKAAIDDVFYGRGYNLKYITDNFSKTLVLATEVSKIYCDELTGEPYPQVINALKDQMKTAILNNAQLFANQKTNWEHSKKSKLLPRDLEKTILKIDRELYRLVKNLEVLNYVNPNNVEREKKKFFDSRCTENPEFTYGHVKIDPYNLKRELHRLEVEKINDISIQNLYQDVVDSYVDKVDLITSIGSQRFLYNNLRYFGEPDHRDIANAEFLLHLPEIHERPVREPILGVEEAVAMFKKSFEDYGFDGKIEISQKTIAAAMVLNRQKKVLIKRGAKFRPKELSYLVHHEIGVHMVTTMNSGLQPLKVFNLGLPVNTATQEGLAVLSEYLSGNILLKRMKELGARVIAVNLMTNGADFKRVFRVLVNDYLYDVEDAYYITTRVFRGGGFTKDYLYLRGFRDVHKFWKAGHDLG
ncbi:MAG: DUF1704 domain-containing protein, partial [Flavobacteriales bacterium]|nr:DUF1704 domain-containing protein [Flavobacteriales bacterium]